MDQGCNDGSVLVHNAITAMVLQFTTLRRCCNSDGIEAHNVAALLQQRWHYSSQCCGTATIAMALQLATLRCCDTTVQRWCCSSQRCGAVVATLLLSNGVATHNATMLMLRRCYRSQHCNAVAQRWHYNTIAVGRCCCSGVTTVLQLAMLQRCYCSIAAQRWLQRCCSCGFAAPWLQRCYCSSVATCNAGMLQCCGTTTRDTAVLQLTTLQLATMQRCSSRCYSSQRYSVMALKLVTLRHCGTIARGARTLQLGMLRHYDVATRNAATLLYNRRCYIVLERWQAPPLKFIFFTRQSPQEGKFLRLKKRERKRKIGGALKLVKDFNYVNQQNTSSFL